MSEPCWINIAVLIATQKEIIAEHGGIAGFRDRNLLSLLVRHLSNFITILTQSRLLQNWQRGMHIA